MSKYITSKETAKIIRKHLKARFPGQKFGVKSDYNSINIKWVDGPTKDSVDKIVNMFQGGGFDGMIDMDYQNMHWLLPDGTTSLAYCSGTENSMGMVDCFDERDKKPHPQAELVQFSSQYVFTERNFSKEALESLLPELQKHGFSPEIKTDYQGAAYFETKDYAEQREIYYKTEKAVLPTRNYNFKY